MLPFMRHLPLITLLASFSLAFAGCTLSESSSSNGGTSDDDDDTGTEFENPGQVDVPTPTGGLQETLPDLSVDADVLANGYAPYGNGPPELVQMSVDPDSCGYIEGCFTGTGLRTVLLFDVTVKNNGPVDLVLGDPFDSLEDYEYPTCHGHPHYKDFAEYELRTPTGTVATGRKQAFCLMDIEDYGNTLPQGEQSFDCQYQGIHAGWGDVYDRDLDCQWIDVTDVQPGTYELLVRINTENKIPEAGQHPNFASTTVTIP